MLYIHFVHVQQKSIKKAIDKVFVLFWWNPSDYMIPKLVSKSNHQLRLLRRLIKWKQFKNNSFSFSDLSIIWFTSLLYLTPISILFQNCHLFCWRKSGYKRKATENLVTHGCVEDNWNGAIEFAIVVMIVTD